MRKKYFHRRPHQPGLYFPAAAGLLLLTAALIPANAAEAPPPPPPAARTEAAPVAVASSDQIQEVVVTARKRKEKSQNVPIAITALSGDKLEEQGINNIRDFYKQVPSMSITIPNARNTSLNIRGLGSSIANDSLESSVGVFVDGVYYARPGSSTFDILDLDSVEVLRGPQGTLFGKNTTAGALNITTKLPSFEPESKAEISGGDYGYGQFKFSTTGPINDVLAYRVAVSGTKRDGFIHDVRTGQDQDDYNDLSFRGQVLYKPNNDFSFRFIVDSDKQKLHCCVGTLKDIVPTQNPGFSFPTRAGNAGYTPLLQSPFKYENDVDNPLLVKTAQNGFSGEANWNVLGGHTLTSITAWRKWTFNPSNDWDYTGLSVLKVNSTYSTQKQFSQELRLASPTDQTVEYVVGLYYFWQYINSDNVNSFGPDAYNFLTRGTSSAGFGALGTAAMNGLTDVQHTEPKTNSYSGFGQTTWHVTDDLSLTGGLRYTYEKKSVDFVEYGYGGTGPLAAAFRNSLAHPNSFDLDYSEGNLSGLASASYKFTDNVLGYVSFNRGYKSGGINVTAVPPGTTQTIDPETANAYEIGLKTEAFNRRLRLNTALFWEDIKNYQANAVFYDASVSPAKTYSYIANVGKVRTRGIEVDAAAVPIGGLTLTASGAFTDPKYLSYPNAPCPVEKYTPTAPTCDASGLIVPGISRWSGYLGANYTLPIGGFRGQDVYGYVDADYSYKSSAQSGTSNYTWLPAYGLVNLRLGARLEDETTDISIWVRNLLDTEYYTAIGTLPGNTGATAGFVGDPRTVGITLRQTF